MGLLHELFSQQNILLTKFSDCGIAGKIWEETEAPLPPQAIQKYCVRWCDWMCICIQTHLNTHWVSFQCPHLLKSCTHRTLPQIYNTFVSSFQSLCINGDSQLHASEMWHNKRPHLVLLTSQCIRFLSVRLLCFGARWFFYSWLLVICRQIIHN